jgi:hypothetical protein
MVEQIKAQTIKTTNNAKVVLNVLIYALAIYGAYTLIVIKGLKLWEIIGK